MYGRTAVRVALGLSLLVTLVVLLAATQIGVLTSFGNDRLGSAPAASATVDRSQPPVHADTGTVKQVLSEFGQQTSPTRAGNPPAAVWSGGPENAGPDIVYSAPVSGSQNCGPRPCRRP